MPLSRENTRNLRTGQLQLQNEKHEAFLFLDHCSGLFVPFFSVKSARKHRDNPVNTIKNWCVCVRVCNSHDGLTKVLAK